jgi:hypothetical protein
LLLAVAAFRSAGSGILSHIKLPKWARNKVKLATDIAAV